MIAKTLGWTPLMHATVIKNIKVVELLLTHQADVNIRNYAGESALLLSIDKNRDITDLLLKNGSDINVYSEDVYVRMTRTPLITPLSIAACLKNFALVNYLLQKGADPNDGVTLLWIIGRDNIEMLKYFLKKGADPNKANPKTGRLPLTLAATSGTLKALKLLIEYGADVNLKESGKFNATALIWAAYQGRKDSVAFLIRNGANVNVKCKETIEKERIMGPGGNALFAAVKGGYGDIVELLLQEGAVDNYKAVNGDTILILAENGLKEAIEKYNNSDKSTREQNAWIEKKYINYKKIVKLLKETRNKRIGKHNNSNPED
jgi:ankyrin repeat protein